MFIPLVSLQNLNLYKYSGVDNSIIANNILSPFFWEPLIKYLIPPFLAPNLITLIGGIFMMLAWILFYVESPTGTEMPTTFTFVTTAILIFLYQTADNLDGKQARKTKNSSPLGELFDHGVDTFMVGIFGLILITILEITYFQKMILFVLLLSVFYMSHWEEYHTNTLILDYVFNPTELQLVCVATLLILSIFPNLPSFELFGISLSLYISMFLLLLGIFANIHYLSSTIKHVYQTNCCSVLHSLCHGIPYLIFFILSLMNVFCLDDAFYKVNFHLFVAMLIVLNAYVTQRLIIHRICKESVVYYHSLLVFYMFYTASVVIGKVTRYSIDTHMATVVMFLLGFAVESVFVYDVINSISTYLNIKVFRINKTN
ncbi:Choline/ethanolaminephosphotransferase [Entamoeba marina]